MMQEGLSYALYRASSSLQIASGDRPCDAFESLSSLAAEQSSLSGS